jgi:hypothetical protein
MNNSMLRSAEARACVAIERRRVAQRHAHLGFLALRADEGVDQCAQPIQGRPADILKDVAQQVRRRAPLVDLQLKKDRGLVREVLIHRPDTDAGLFGDPRRREAAQAFGGQHLHGRLQDGRDQLGRAGLLRLLSRRNLGAT